LRTKKETDSMNILCIMRKDPDATITGVLDAQRQKHTVTVMDIRREQDYGRIVELIFSSDSVITW